MSRKRNNKKGVALHDDMEPFLTYGDQMSQHDYTKPVVNKTYTPDGKGGWVETTNSATNYSNKGTTQTKMWCKHGVIPAYIFEGITFYGGAAYDLDSPLGYDLVIDLAGVMTLDKRNNNIITGGPPEFVKLNELTARVPPIVSITWKDFGVPAAAGWEFWREFTNQVKKSGAKDVLVTCQGGHGRTGTCLSLIHAFLTGSEGWDSIKFVRESYCKSAVETPSQEDYIMAVVAGKI